MSFFSLKIRPFLRNLGIISLMLCLTVFVTYFADTLDAQGRKRGR